MAVTTTQKAQPGFLRLGHPSMIHGAGAATGVRRAPVQWGLRTRQGGAMEPDTVTVIDANANVEGKLTGKDARIMGKFRGEIALSGRLFMGEGSRVEAKVVARGVPVE